MLCFRGDNYCFLLKAKNSAILCGLCLQYITGKPAQIVQEDKPGQMRAEI